MLATAVSDHGGLADDDLHLGLIISNPFLKPGVVTDKVSQTQVCVHHQKLQGAALHLGLSLAVSVVL